MMHDISNAPRTRNDATIGARRFPGVPFEKFATADDFEPGLGEGLAVFRGYRSGDLILSLAHDCRCLEQNIGPLDRRRCPPGLESLFSRFQRIVEVTLFGVRKTADLLLRRWIDDGEVVGGLAPFAIDIKMQVRISTHRSSRVGYRGPIIREVYGH